MSCKPRDSRSKHRGRARRCAPRERDADVRRADNLYAPRAAPSDARMLRCARARVSHERYVPWSESTPIARSLQEFATGYQIGAPSARDEAGRELAASYYIAGIRNVIEGLRR